MDPLIVEPTWADEIAASIVGRCGSAWIVDLANTQDTRPEAGASVTCWTLRCPKAHPCWRWWMLAVIHLRPIVGVREPVRFTMPNATHELIIATLDPSFEPPDPRHMGPAHYLTPPDVSEQFQVGSDVQAAELGRQAVIACCEGRLSPDSDYRPLWHYLVAQTAAHARRPYLTQ